MKFYAGLRTKTFFLSAAVAVGFLGTTTSPRDANAAIPRASYIVQEVALRAGNGTYQIEQDVTFTTANSTLTLKENWLVSTDGQMRLTVRPSKDSTDQVRIQFIYAGGQKLSQTQRGKQSGKQSEEFLERFLHNRSRDAYFGQLANLKILPASYLNHKATRGGKEFNYPVEPLNRLTRIAGVTAYTFGEPSVNESQLRPAAWIEQDVFHLRKLRFPSGAFITADRYGSYPRSLWLPKARQVNWDQKSAEIGLVKVSALPTVKNDKRFQSASLEFSSQIGGISDSEMQKTVEEFYQRFR